MKPLTLLIAGLLLAVTSQAQSSVWQKSARWTLYNIRGAKFYKVPLDSLDQFKKKTLNDDSMRTFLSVATELPADKSPMWMGAYVVSCSIDGRTRKIDVSSYGGFFYDESTRKYYSIPENSQKDWLNYLAACAGSLSIQ
jgi:hypothetical protein